MSPAFQSDLKKYHHDVLIKNAENIEMPDYRNIFVNYLRGISTPKGLVLINKLEKDF